MGALAVMLDSPVILHIPHSSTYIPADELDLFVLTPDELAAENLRLADLYTDELYNLPGAGRAVFPVSRFVVDAERFPDDGHEPMAARGMGALYQVTTHLNPLRPEIPANRRTHLMDRYYWPHHNGLDTMAEECLRRFGHCLIIDCHSYPSRALPYEMGNMSLPRPEIGLGTDKFHTHSDLSAAFLREFRSLGYEVGLDTPFSGSLVPNKYYGKDARVQSIMIEVRKNLYMDERTGQKIAAFNDVRSDLLRVMSGAVKIIPGF